MPLAIIPHSPAVDVSAIDRAALAPSTKAQYRKVIERMSAAGVNPDDHAQLQDYAAGLKQSSRQFLKSALRLMTMDFEQTVKANATPGNIASTQAALLRLEAMRGAVQVQQPKGQKAHTWLSAAQVSRMTSYCPDTLEGKRDWIILGLLLGAGLRREELVSLKFDAVKTLPTKDGGTRTVIEVLGKGRKFRTIPISAKLAFRLHEWKQIAGDGYIVRSLGRSMKLGESMSAVSVFELCMKYGRKIGVELPAHSCRRTYAQLGFEAGIPITQISTLLGHSSVAVTQRYLNLALDLESSASDFIPLS